MDETSMKGAPRSEQFDDVYFSALDGLAETRHVFLQSNDLPASFAASGAEFTICETGFGTGLNFLAVWKLFEENAPENQRLHFISFEKFPLSASQIEEYLDIWRDEFPEELGLLVAYYPSDVSAGVRSLQITPRITLTLIFGDVNERIPALDAKIDCWFLDGFKPSSNPDMWSETLFTNMARLSKKGAHFATFTAAGFVKRGLIAAGFEVQKIRGHGRKREMLAGRYRGALASGVNIEAAGDE